MPDENIPADDGDLITAFRLGRYRKTITAAAIGLLAWAGVVVTSDPAAITGAEWVQFGGIWLVALGVYAVPNRT